MLNSNISFTKTVVKSNNFINSHYSFFEQTLDNILHIIQNFLDNGFIPFVSDLQNIVFAELNKIGLQNIEIYSPVYFSETDLNDGYLHYKEKLTCYYQDKKFPFELEIEIDLDENLLASFEITLPEKMF